MGEIELPIVDVCSRTGTCTKVFDAARLDSYARSLPKDIHYLPCVLLVLWVCLTSGGLGGLSATPTVSTVLEGEAAHIKTGKDSPKSLIAETQVRAIPCSYL